VRKEYDILIQEIFWDPFLQSQLLQRHRKGDPALSKIMRLYLKNNLKAKKG
jgi:hypothetical protein